MPFMVSLCPPLDELQMLIRMLEQNALALVATFPAEAVRLAYLASLMRSAVPL
jgi:hypothetical protein